MSVAGDLMELSEAEITVQFGAALALLEGFEHAPRLAQAEDAPLAERSAGLGTRRRFRSTTPGLAGRRTGPAGGAVRLIERIEAADGGDALISVTQAAVLQGLRRALAIALAVGDAFGRATELSRMKRENLDGRLAAADRTGFAELLAAQALATGFTFANATAFLLAGQAGEAQADAGPAEEILTETADLALKGALWEMDRAVETHGADEPRMVAAILAKAEALMEAFRLRASDAPRLAAFEAARWRIAADDMTLAGFQPSGRSRGSVLTMQFKKPHEVVGNHIAKHQAMKLAKMLMAYDFERKTNPFAEMGGFIFTFMGDGKPGTGKTTLIQMMAGLIHEYCGVAGYPFRYQNFSIDQIDSYQGKSGQNAKAFIETVMNPNVIGFGTIDDIDQIAGKRGDRQSSAGQQEVTAVFMEAFSGANTVVRGNCSFGMFSNYPENVDDALRQRAGARFLVDGPQSREDYIDILALLLGKRHEIALGDHALYAAQEIRRAVERSFEAYARPQEDGLRAVWDRVTGEIGPLDTIAKLGAYLKAIQEADDRFTGRAIKNITDAVKVRAMDFELPDAWMEEPELFLFRPYDEKLAMIEDMRKPITVDMVVQEINRYADSEFRYADKSDEAAVEALVRDFGRTDEARRRYQERTR